MIRLERLQVYDIGQVVDLAYEFNTVYNVDLKFNKTKARSGFEAVVVYPNTYFCTVMKDEDTVVGFLLGFCSEGIYYDNRLASEIGWYIKEEYRGKATGVLMLKDFEQWAKEEAKADFVSMSYTAEMSNLKTLYERLGYVEAEHTYKKVLT